MWTAQSERLGDFVKSYRIGVQWPQSAMDYAAWISRLDDKPRFMLQASGSLGYWCAILLMSALTLPSF